jgi:3',5'-cyclic-AMP phosphodiesterase
MLIAQITDTHIKLPGALAYGKVDTAAMLARCVAELGRLAPQPDLIVITGDLVDLGRAEEYAHLRSLLKPLGSPLVVVPGNHDDRSALRAAFADHAYLPARGFLQFAIDAPYPVRIVGLDTLVPMQGGGELCAERLAWLDETLARQPQRPTVVLMHHPPFVTGIGHMDKLGLAGRDEFSRVVGRHPQVELVLCGHLHRSIQARVGGRAAMTCPSTAHQVALDLRDDAPSRFNMEPPGYLLHRWTGSGFVSHQACIGDYAGPFPFFADDGSLID